MNTQVVFKGYTSIRPFGVELEVNDRISKPEIRKVIQQIDPLHEVEVTEWSKSINGLGWHVKRDGTCGHEVATYKMSGFEDLDLVGQVADAMRRRGCQADNRCGLHVHADLSDFEVDHMGIMLSYWLKIERVVLQSCPAHRRDNKHCRLMRDKFRIDRIETFPLASDIYYHLEPGDTKDHDNEDKRVTLNFVPYVIHRNKPDFKKNTAEIRMPEGTLIKENVVNWVRLYLHFVDACRARSMPDNLSSVGLKETLQILDLMGTKTFYLLGKGLYETRKWFLKRIIQNTDDMSLYKEAESLLNEMTQPLETHPRRARIFAANQPTGAI